MQKKVKRMLKNEQTFFSHLVELKKRVTISLLFYIVAVIVCYQFAADIYQFLLNPLETEKEAIELSKFLETPLENYTI